jgi:ACR3 family arsenite transporter
MPDFFSLVASLEIAHINLLIAVFIWLMIYPMMVQIDFSSIKDVTKKPKGIILTLVVNWLIKPFSMALLASLFFKFLYQDFFTLELANEYIAGAILLGVAPCTAMVFVWSQLTRGDPSYTLVQVAVNDLVMVFAFVPIASFLLGLNDIVVPWDTLILSVLLYVGLPLVAGYLTRKKLEKKSSKAVEAFLSKIKPLSISGLILTVVLLFAMQAETIVQSPLTIVLIAIPLLIQTYSIFAITYFSAKLLGLPHKVASPAAMIGASNFFELAVAVAISLFGLHSGAALATVVGVLVEVPVMLSLVSFSNKTRKYFK